MGIWQNTVANGQGGEAIRICLIDRYLDLRNAGIGRIFTKVKQGLEERGIEVRAIFTNGNSLPSYLVYTLLEIPLRLPAERDYDIFHALTPMEGLWLPRAKGIVSINDLILLTHPERAGAGLGSSGWKNWVGRKYFEFACSMAKGSQFIITISEEVKWEIVRLLKVPEGKVRHIRLGINENLSPNPKQGPFRLGYLGQLDRRKRVDLLIRAFTQSKLEIELVIAGTGPDKDYLLALAGSDSRIKFLGGIPDTALGTFYNSLDIFVFPTWIEGYGLPPVEAMACHRPTIILKDAIMPFEVKSRCIQIDSLERAFAKIKSLEELVRTVNLLANYKFAKLHNWGDTITQYLKVYEEVMG